MLSFAKFLDLKTTFYQPNIRPLRGPFFDLKLFSRKPDNLYVSPKNKYLIETKKNVIKLRSKLAHHESAGTEPPVSIFNELKMAELLLKLESTDSISLKYKTIDLNWSGRGQSRSYE